jgi:hypothetical protein
MRLQFPRTRFSGNRSRDWSRFDPFSTIAEPSSLNFSVSTNPMTTKSILKHPYWQPPEGGKCSPYDAGFCIQAMKAFVQWREEAYDIGAISHDEYVKYLNGGVEDIPG